MKTRVCLVQIVALTCFSLHARSQVANNFRLNPASTNHHLGLEIAQSPDNLKMIFVSSITFTPTLSSQGCFLTTNGGISWNGSDNIRIGGIGVNEWISSVTIDRRNLILAYTTTSNFRYSADGLLWSLPVSLQNFSFDSPEIESDARSSSPFYGRTYLVSTNFSGTLVNRIVRTFSTDDGITWAVAAAVSPMPSTGHHHTGSDIAIGPNGEVYVAWANSRTSGQNSTEDSLGFAISTDGGVSWARATNSADDMNGIRSPSFFTGIRVEGFPRLAVDKTGGARDGWVYVAAAEKFLPPFAMDSSDIVLHRSTDRGLTWTRSRVNQDAPGSGKHQFMPAIAVDTTGAINVVYYDSRNVVTNDSAEIYLSRSSDGGETWSDQLVSDHRFRPKVIQGLTTGYSGIGMGIVATSSHLLAVWCDDATGLNQVWGARIPFSTTSISNETRELQKFKLEQNYPNPFNPMTTIEFQLPRAGIATLRVFDLLGREVSRLLDGEMKPGRHRVTFDAANLASGFYFYKLKAAGLVQVKKMLLVR
jgi:hypothetical protein